MTVGLIGYGYWGKILERNLPNLSYIYDPALHHNKVLSNLLEKSDHVFIASPTVTHFELVERALLEGCHVFCEKPLCLESEQVDSLFKIANKKKLKLLKKIEFEHVPNLLNNCPEIIKQQIEAEPWLFRHGDEKSENSNSIS